MQLLTFAFDSFHLAFSVRIYYD